MTLTHHSLSTTLSKRLTEDVGYIDLEPLIRHPLELHSYPLYSDHTEVYPEEDYNESSSLFKALLRYYLDENEFSDKFLFHHLQWADRTINENKSFSYHMVQPKKEGPFNGVILLFHGLNEKSWDKYLPWATTLSDHTGRPVILFPLAFHMDRAPRSWSNPRSMIPVARERKKLFPDLPSVSFVNAALSHRIQFAPHRFITSGLHSFFDVRDLTRAIRSGNHPSFAEGASVDIFGYSIGASLAELLLLADPEQLFSDSRAFLLCGGSTLDLSTPVSKTIIDGEAYKELFSFFNRLFGDIGALGEHLLSLTGKCIRELEWLKSLLFIDRLKAQREGRLRQIAHRISAAVMKRDQVFSPEAVRTTLTGASGTIPIQIEEYDLPFPYSHETPFPTSWDHSKGVTSAEAVEVEVDHVFQNIMNTAGRFFCNV